jgi:hypothetical protein
LDENRMKLWLGKGVAKHPGGLLKRPAMLVCDQFKLTHNCGSKEEDQGLKHAVYCNTRRPHWPTTTIGHILQLTFENIRM